jgi:hypothetical protein
LPQVVSKAFLRSGVGGVDVGRAAVGDLGELGSLAGLMESKYLPEAGATNLPPMKRS